ncbi:MAG: hypothetical protein K2G83_07465, partial [Ruminococcus sp.]|nr:hypothetical protein [Ruminococcus sp.]
NSQLNVDSLPADITEPFPKLDTPIVTDNNTTNNNPVTDYIMTTDEQNRITQTSAVINTGETTYVSSSTNKYTSSETSALLNLMTETPAPDDPVNLQEEAQKLYDAANDVYFHLIYTRDGLGFSPNYDEDMFSEVISGNDFGNLTAIDDVKREMRKTFADPVASEYEAMIEQNFCEKNGKLYSFINGKGGDLYFKNVELIPVYSDENLAKFNAVAHYLQEDITRPFSIVYENGSWKVSEYTCPYCEAHKTVSENPTENSELTAMAFEIYKKAHNMYFHILRNGTYYETNGNFIIDETGLQLDEISDSRVSCINDIKSEITDVFSESLASEYYHGIEHIYRESEGKLYQIKQNKGDPIDYEQAELELIYA